MLKGQSFVVQSEQVQQGGIEIVQGMDVLHGRPSQFIGHAMADSFANSGAGHPTGEPVRVVIPSLSALLEKRHASEFGAPDHEGVLQKTPLSQVADEGRRGLIEDGRVAVVLFLELVVTVPVEFAAAGVGPIEELHKPHAPLHEPPCQDAVAGKTRLDGMAGVVRSVGPQDVGRLGRQVADLRNAELHSRRQLIAGDSRGEFFVTGVRFEVALVQLPEQASGGLIGLAGDSGSRQVPDRILGAPCRSLKGGWQEA